MFARMCLLQIIPGAFDGYVPPTGINVAWYWDFEGKEDNQVIAFFTSQEISVNDYDTHKDGDIKAEVENNRCFIHVKTIKKSDWDKVIPDFAYQGQILQIPKIHPSVKDEWIPKEKVKKHKFINKDGIEEETEELFEYESEIDEDAFAEINRVRDEKNMGLFIPDKSKIREVKNEGQSQQKPKKMITVDCIKVVDEIKPESQ